jgi:hypothetical protein
MLEEDRELWKSVMEEEYGSLLEDVTFIFSGIFDRKKAVKNKWVLMAKESPNGSTSQYNAWLFTRGFTLEYGVDCD